MRVLVTGGSGNVGRFVVTDLTKRHEVKILDIKEPENGNVEFIKGDIRELESLCRCLNDVDAVVHLAAIPVPPERVSVDPMEFWSTNITGTFNVLESASRCGVEKVVFASSDSAMGFVFSEYYRPPRYLPVDERHPLKPQDLYGLSKLVGEEICKRYSRRYGISTICLRTCCVWFPETYRHIRKIVEEDAKLNTKMLWGYVDARDAAQAYRLSVEARDIKHDIFFITAKNTFAPVPSLKLLEECYPGVEVLKREQFVKDRYKSLFNISKAEKILRYKPKYDWRKLVASN